jgi:hypothetical protein
MMMIRRKPTKGEAIRQLVGGQITIGLDGENPVFHDGQTPPTDEEANTKLASMISDWDAQEYARNRKPEYDALNQFELMTDDAANSTTAHADAIAVIKTKWPKDNSGPV